jgi:hypothetical protein
MSLSFMGTLALLCGILQCHLYLQCRDRVLCRTCAVPLALAPVLLFVRGRWNPTRACALLGQVLCKHCTYSMLQDWPFCASEWRLDSVHRLQAHCVSDQLFVIGSTVHSQPASWSFACIP